MRLSRIQLTITSKAKVPVTFLLTNLLVSIASAGEVDARFDGKWAGLEAFRSTTPGLTWKVPQRATVIEISRSGKVLNVLSGFVPGFYPVSPRSGGNILIFYGGNGFEGRKYCRLKLSADGKTLEELGAVVVAVRRPYQTTSAAVYGTFHRVGK
jgi:hypothetical protein